MELIQIDRLFSIPSMNQVIFSFQDRLEQPVITLIVFGDQNGQLVFLHGDGLMFVFLFVIRISGLVGNGEPESGSFSFFRFYADASSHVLYNRLANG